MKLFKRNFFNLKTKYRKGFTLLEIMIVLVILGTLITIFVVSIDTGDTEQARLHNITSRSQISVGMLRFRQSCGRYPTQEEGLQVLSGESQPDTDDCPQRQYIPKKNLLKDFYKNDYVYSVSDDGTYKIVSLGADGREGGTGKNLDVDIQSIE